MIIKIESLDHQARGIAHIDGKVIFIPNALPGELVKVKITQDKKNYSLGKVIDYIEISDKRNKPVCPYFIECGGCHTSHMKYHDSIDFKKDTLINIIKKYANLDINPEIIKSKEINYRNKIALKINNYKWGYYEEESHNFIPIKECLLAKEVINSVISNQELFKIKNGEIIIKCNYLDELMIILNSKDKVKLNYENIINKYNIRGIIINNKIVYGEGFFTEKVNDVEYQVNYDSFFQVNINILNEVLKILNEKEYDSLLDLYCGVGTLGLGVKTNKLYGIEISSSAINNALKNNELNKQNGLFILGDSSKIKEIKEDINTIIIDPPRSGISKETVNYLLKKDSDEIIYMSCSPITLARDIDLLKDKYKLSKIYLLDMFPNTYHIETLCFFIKNESEK